MQKVIYTFDTEYTGKISIQKLSLLFILEDHYHEGDKQSVHILNFI
jgi:hypothetical protein